jgi:hypothetical protein
MTDRVIHTTSPEEANRLRHEAEAAEAERDEIIEQFAKQDAAASERSAAGQLRRAISASLILPAKVAAATGIPLDTLQRFRSGEGDLALSECERLADFLNARLVVEVSVK